MQQYVGTKTVNVKPMTRLAYNQLRGWVLPADENGDDKGYLVEYVDGGKANHPDFKGYISWSPKDVFDREYRPIEGMTFGMAIEKLKWCKKISRKGWNGPGQYVWLQPVKNLTADECYSQHFKDIAELNGGTVRLAAVACLYTTNKVVIIGWTPSQTDMMAEDWFEVE
jgi:hypothetical protein